MKETENAQQRENSAQIVVKETTYQVHRNATARENRDHQDLTETGMEVDHHEEVDAHLEEEDKVEVGRRTTIAPRCGTRTREATGKSWRSST